ncbi:MAG: SRPBCC family protein [Opitutae bacterium]|nr:SRPBCC family protein [Opitutae bacterium]
MPSPFPQSLRAALLGNAAFSLLSGVSFVIFAAPLAAFVSAASQPAVFRLVGLGLLVFAGLVGALGRRARPDPWLALGVSFADLVWVLGSAVLLALAWSQLTAGGAALTAGIAAAVLGIALAQLRGIAQTYAADASGRSLVCLEIHSAGRPDVIWRNLSDLGSIARFAPSLSFSRLRDPAVTRVGAVRECGDHGGREWAELCKRFDAAAREIEADFLVDEPGFPFPFAALEGGWSVRAGEAGGSVVRVWLRGRPKPRLLTPLILPLLEWQSRRTFGPTVQRLAQEPGAPASPDLARWAIIPC